MLSKRKKRERLNQPLSSLVTRALTCVNGRLIRCAEALQRETSRLSPQRLKGLLCLFCFIFLSASAYVVINSLHGKELSFRIQPIQAMPLAKRPLQQSTISESEFIRLHRLRLSLDSLAKSPSGKILFDSLIKKHPNLLDTLKILENIYLEKHKK